MPTYDLVVDMGDHLALGRHVARRARPRRWVLAAIWLALVGMFFVASRVGRVAGVDELRWAFYVSLTLACIGAVFAAQVFRWTRVLAPRATGFVLGAHRVTASEEGISVALANGSSVFHPYAAITDVAETPQYVFVFVDTTWGLSLAKQRWAPEDLEALLGVLRAGMTAASRARDPAAERTSDRDPAGAGA